MSKNLLPQILIAVLGVAAGAVSGGPQGYYRFPAISGDTVVFTAEGDLWKVGAAGGVAERLTSHPGSETFAQFSPDGKTLAFAAMYEGPTEVYTMPIEGGLPTRRTYYGGNAAPVGWTPDGKIIYVTRQFSTLPDSQLATVDLVNGANAVIPLAQASDGVFDPSGKTLYFTRLSFQGSLTKRYRGGDIQQVWKFTAGDPEAIPLTADFDGTSKNPMWWQDRIYFISDRDGAMNLWSMTPAGGDLRQLTHHRDWDVKSASLSNGRIVYQFGADLWLYDVATGTNTLIPIALTSDFDQEREKWVKKPMDFLTSAELSPNGDRLALTARGQVFVAPARQGRFVDVTRDPSVRYRNAHFMPDGKSLVALSDASGELEFWKLAANGLDKPAQLTRDNGHVYRFAGIPSPDGKWIGYGDKDYKLWLFNVDEKQSHQIDASKVDGISDLAWSPDSQWLAYVRAADNTYPQIWIHSVKTGKSTEVTTDRVNSYSPVWSPDGKWLYFLSDRHFATVVGSPWGLRAPEPYFDEPVGIFYASLLKEQRSPFQANDELHPADAEKEKDKDKDKDKKKDETNAAPKVEIELTGLQARVQPVPIPPGNYQELAMTAKQLFVLSSGSGLSGRTNRTLQILEITNDDPKLKPFSEHVDNFELSLDLKKILIRKDDSFYILASDTSAPAKLEKSVPLGDWTFPLNPRQEWRQMFTEAWRLERDYFYDRQMHGVDWPAVLKRHLPVVDRVTDRDELSDLISDMVGELSALHIFVRGGDSRPAPDNIQVASLGALYSPDASAGGYRIDHIFRSDPDYPERQSPLLRPGVGIHEGDVIEAVNGIPALAEPMSELLRHQANRQVLLKARAPGGGSRETIVTPFGSAQEFELRYDEWEYTRRLKTEELGRGDIGYVHLRAMGPQDIARWARDYYPVFDRKGLIIDVRHNSGGSIDSWILEKLLRKAWLYWQSRAGQPYWNMQYAFRGHIVVLCDQRTASDGEAFSEGFRRLGLGKVIGARTWGGEIWLSASNWLVDRGIATAAEDGVYGPEGKWLIEGHGVDPDIVVDNLPHSTFEGRDAQLEKAIEVLQDEIKREPVTVPPPPAYPDKSLK